jgi:anti-anti-sigma factor
MPPSIQVADTPEPLAGQPLRGFRLPTAAGAARLMLVGELDLVTAACAREAVRCAQDATTTLTCDLGDVWFIDFSGLRVLLDATTHGKLTGGRLMVANCPPLVPRMLQVLKLEDTLEIQAPPWPPAPSAPRCVRLHTEVN